MMERIDVTVLGREYSLACVTEEKTALLVAVHHADQLMQRIKASGKVSGNERIAVMAALQLASELLSFKAGDNGGEGGLALGEFKRKIDLMNEMLDEAPLTGGPARHG